MSTWRLFLLLTALTLGFAPHIAAQTALNQVYLAAAISSDSATQITLSVADDVAAQNLIVVDGETMAVVSCNSTTDICTVRRGVFGRPTGHVNRSIVYTGAANRFYSWSPAADSRCVRSTAYPFGYEPWINIENGDIYACSQTFGLGSTVAGQWVKTNFQNPWASPGYRAILYPTSRTADALVITPSVTVRFWESFVASMTYSGPFEVFLPNPTGLPLGKRVTVHDAAGLANMSPGGRTISIRGLFENGDNTVTLGKYDKWAGPLSVTQLFTGIGASTSFYVGITASSMYYWMISAW